MTHEVTRTRMLVGMVWILVPAFAATAFKKEETLSAT